MAVSGVGVQSCSSSHCAVLGSRENQPRVDVAFESCPSDLLLPPRPHILKATHPSKWHTLETEGSEHESVGDISDWNSYIQDLKGWHMGGFCTALANREASAERFRVYSELKLPRFESCLYHILAFKSWVSPSVPFPVVLNCAKGMKVVFSLLVAHESGWVAHCEEYGPELAHRMSTNSHFLRCCTELEGGGYEDSIPISQWSPKHPTWEKN